MPEHPAELPESIGAYRILGVLGQGGMGIVYEAEQQQPRRRVALKVVRGGAFVDEARVRMFRREAETLARLDHPDIGAIYESGRTADGQHFFAMELVRGRTLDAWLRERGPSLHRDELHLRLRLGRRLCEAVHYAHQRGVIHRDLKPTNVIVLDAASGEGEPAIKILDFGLARITDADVAATMVTEVGMIKGTLAYMSPEQARGDPAGIDVRSDIYSLGVILYEMIAGLRPYAIDSTSLIEAARAVCEESPRPLRDVWSGDGRLDADVETIVHKSLEKEADRRYASAAALAEDLQRYLTSQPIVARPPSTAYLLRKLIQRRKTPFALAAALLVVIVGFGVGMAVLYAKSQSNLRRAVAAESAASENFGLARDAVDRYLTRVSESPELQAAGLEELRRELLDSARQFYETFAERQADTPELQHELAVAHLRLGGISRVVGEIDRAEEVLARGVEKIEPLIGDGEAGRSARIDLAALLSTLALVQSETGQDEKAERTFARGVALERALMAEVPDSADLRSRHANTLDNLAQFEERRGRLDEAEPHFREALDTWAELTAREPDETGYRLGRVRTAVNIGGFYARRGRLDEALTAMSAATADADALMAAGDPNPEHANTYAALYSNIGGVHMLRGELDRCAEAYDRETSVRERLSSDHPNVLDYRLKLGSSYTNLGELAVREGRPAEALPEFDRAQAELGQVLEREPRHVTGRFFLSYTHGWRARALDALGRHAEALRDWDRAIELDDRGDPELRAGREASAAAIER